MAAVVAIAAVVSLVRRGRLQVFLELVEEVDVLR